MAKRNNAAHTNRTNTDAKAAKAEKPVAPEAPAAPAAAPAFERTPHRPVMSIIINNAFTVPECEIPADFTSDWMDEAQMKARRAWREAMKLLADAGYHVVAGPGLDSSMVGAWWSDDLKGGKSWLTEAEVVRGLNPPAPATPATTAAPATAAPAAPAAAELVITEFDYSEATDDMIRELAESWEVPIATKKTGRGKNAKEVMDRPAVEHALNVVQSEAAAAGLI